MHLKSALRGCIRNDYPKYRRFPSCNLCMCEFQSRIYRSPPNHNLHNHNHQPDLQSVQYRTLFRRTQRRLNLGLVRKPYDRATRCTDHCNMLGMHQEHNTRNYYHLNKTHHSIYHYLLPANISPPRSVGRNDHMMVDYHPISLLSRKVHASISSADTGLSDTYVGHYLLMPSSASEGRIAPAQ